MILEVLVVSLVTSAVICTCGVLASLYFVRREKRRADLLMHADRCIRVKP